MEYIEYINNYEELKSHVGEILVFSYAVGTSDEHTWMKKVTKIKPPMYFFENDMEDSKKSVQHHCVYGTHNLLIIDKGKPTQKIIGHYDEERMSNAQQIARTPTKEEMKTYMNALRKYRVFGNI